MRLFSVSCQLYISIYTVECLIQSPDCELIIKTFEAWQKRNYGELSKHLKKLFSFEVTDSKRAGECKKLFSSKQLIDFEIHEIEERGCCLTRILTKATWEKEDETITELLEFGSAYLN